MAKRPTIFNRTLKYGKYGQGERTPLTDPPRGWLGSIPEFLVMKELVNTHRLEEGKDFTYQSRFSTIGGYGGRQELGGLIADFYLPDRYLIINPLSEYYHYRVGLGVIAQEKENRNALAQQGIQVVWIDTDQLNSNPKYYVAEALNYRDYSKLGRGIV